MPPHPPIDPQGIYHVGSRGTYGRPLFRNDDQHELFLSLYERSAEKYGWQTLAWVLMKNHHHFVIQLTDDGLSAGMQEIHSGYSRRIHAIYFLSSAEAPRGSTGATGRDSQPRSAASNPAHSTLPTASSASWVETPLRLGVATSSS